MVTLPVVIAVCATLLDARSPQATTPDAEITRIRQHYTSTRQALPTLRKRTIDVMDWSTEGGTATGYFRQQELRLVEAAIYGEMGQSHTEYYFVGGKLIFVLERERHYAFHVHQRPSLQGATTSTQRYYFSGGHLIRWLNSWQEPVVATGPERLQKQQQLLAEAQELQQRLAGAGR
ncbi:hypothetical protein GCM10027048_07270 [Hymenobacter coalescens]